MCSTYRSRLLFFVRVSLTYMGELKRVIGCAASRTLSHLFVRALSPLAGELLLSSCGGITHPLLRGNQFSPLVRELVLSSCRGVMFVFLLPSWTEERVRAQVPV